MSIQTLLFELISAFGIVIATNVNVSCNLGSSIINTTSESFISFNLDYGDVHHPIDYTNSTLIYLAKQLSPSYMRVAGTSADYAYYQIGNENPCHLPPPNKVENYTCLAMDSFNQLVTFTNAINSKLIWNIAAGYPLYPTINSSAWNSSNTKQFLQYLHDNMSYTNNDIYGFCLGNEMNEGDPFFNATWQSNAFKELNKLLSDIWGTNNHKFAFLGPDPHSGTVRNSSKSNFIYIEEFFDETCDILSFGDYHVYIDLKSPNDYLTPSGLDVQHWESQQIMNNIDYNRNDCVKSLKDKIFAGEIGSVNGNGPSPEWGEWINRYWSGFWWLDAIGFVSQIGQKAALRWVLYQKSAGSGNKNFLGVDFVPNPDYYTAVLYKNLMSINVLSINSDNEYFRIYSHCTSKNINTYIYNDNKLNLNNPVTMSYIVLLNNTDYEYVNIYIQEINDLINGDVILWSLIPGNKTAGLQSKTMMLNDELLKLTNANKLPSLKGKLINVDKNNPYIQVPALTYGFIVFTDTDIASCG